METQNTEVCFHFLDLGAQRALQEGCTPVERLNGDALRRRAVERRLKYHEVSAIIREDHNTDIGRGLLASIHDSKRKRSLWEPPAAEEARNPALKPAFGMLARRRGARRFALQRLARTSVAWLVVVLAILCVLTVMLIMEIAISV